MTEAAPGFVCPLCGGTHAAVALTLHDILSGTTDAAFPLARCAECGLLRLHPPPDDATLAAAYPDDYAPHSRRGVSGWAKTQLERRAVRQLRRYLAPPRAVLDLGCSTGELLLAVRAAGNPRVLGVEPSARAAAQAQARGLAVRVGTLDDAQLPDASIDAVLISHTLEHVRDPVATLHTVARLLRPGGAVILWLPNADSAAARALGARWIGYDAPRHLTTFTLSTLSQALAAAGLRVADVRHEAVGLEWAWALRLWLRAHWPRLESALAPAHPLLVAAATPLSVVAALRGRAGRVRVVAVKGMR